MATSAPAVIYAGLCQMTGGGQGGEVHASTVKNFQNLRFVENDLPAYLVGARVAQVLTRTWSTFPDQLVRRPFQISLCPKGHRFNFLTLDTLLCGLL